MGELVRDGAVIELRPLSVALLAYLILHRDRVVGADELTREIWRGVTVASGSLRQAIFELRQALGVRSDDPRIVLTVRGRGYRFVADVGEVSDDGSVSQCIASARAQDTPTSSPPHHPDPIFGRTQELRQLAQALKEAALHGRACTVVGGAGVGKTRLTRELVRVARLQGVSCYEAINDPDGAAPAFWPWVRLLRDWLSSTPGAAELLEHSPGVRALVQDQGGHTTGPAEAAVAQPRFSLLDELGRLFATAFSQAPHLLVFDDLQWADEASLAVLRHLAPLLARTRVLLVVTCRSVDPSTRPAVARALGALRRGSLNLQLELENLAEPDIREMLAFHAASEVSSEESGRVHALSDGNPLLATEISLLCARRGFPARHSWANTIPDIREVVRRRLETLPAQVRTALLASSVLHSEFTVAALANVLAQSPADALTLLDGCIECGMLVDGDGSRYRFAHPALRDAIYVLLTRRERATLHQRVGEWMERDTAQCRTTWLNELAHHFFLAAPLGCADKATTYALRCAEQAYGLTAYNDAIAHFDRALLCADLDPAVTVEQKLSIALSRGESLRASGCDTEKVNKYFLALAERADELRCPTLFARAVLGYTGQRPLRYTPTRFVGARNDVELALIERALEALGREPTELRGLLLCSLIGGLLYTTADARRAAALREATEVAESLEIPSLTLRVLAIRIHCCAGPGDARDRMLACDSFVTLAQRSGLRAHEADGLMARCMLRLTLGQLEAAERDAAQARHLASALGSTQMLARCELLSLMRAFWNGDITTAKRLTQQAMDASPDDVAQRSFFMLRMHAIQQLEQDTIEGQVALHKGLLELYPDAMGFHCALASGYVAEGRHELARQHFDRVAEGGFSSLPKDVNWLGEMALLADAAHHMDDAERAQLVYEQLLPHSGLFDIFLGEAAPAGPVAFWLAGLSVTRRDFASARHWLSVAKSLNVRLGATLFQHYARLVEARMLSLESPRALGPALTLIREVMAFADARQLPWLRSRAELELRRMPPHGFSESNVVGLA